MKMMGKLYHEVRDEDLITNYRRFLTVVSRLQPDGPASSPLPAVFAVPPCAPFAPPRVRLVDPAAPPAPLPPEPPLAASNPASATPVPPLSSYAPMSILPTIRRPSNVAG